MVAAAWEASYRCAPEHRKAEYLAVFGLGPAAQEIVGPPLVTLVVVGLAAPGWVVLAGLLVAVVPLVPRAVGDLALQEG